LFFKYTASRAYAFGVKAINVGEFFPEFKSECGWGKKLSIRELPILWESLASRGREFTDSANTLSPRFLYRKSHRAPPLCFRGTLYIKERLPFNYRKNHTTPNITAKLIAERTHHVQNAFKTNA
jgi:hypothetical protein